MKVKQQKPMTEQERVMANVNMWRKHHKLPPVGKGESPQKFKQNFNSVANKLEGVRV